MQSTEGVTGALCCHILVYLQSQQATATQPRNILLLHENTVSSSWPMIKRKHSARKSQKVQFSNWAINLNHRGSLPEWPSKQPRQHKLANCSVEPEGASQHVSLMTPMSPSSCTPGPLRPGEKPGNTSQSICTTLSRIPGQEEGSVWAQKAEKTQGSLVPRRFNG